MKPIVTAIVAAVTGAGALHAQSPVGAWFSPKTFEAGEDCQWQPAAIDDLHMNAFFIAGPQRGQDRARWLTAMQTYRRLTREGKLGEKTLTTGNPARTAAAEKAAQARAAQRSGPLDLRSYDRADLAWAAHAFTCAFVFMYDRSFYDPAAGRYTIDSLLDDGNREFGGYDAIVLWHAYPRIGVDQRNQCDMYRDMPGGLTALREVVRQAHARNVKVFINYNPWDTGTRREQVSDERMLADVVGAIEADGIFLDTLAAASVTLRQTLDRTRSGVVLAPEIHPTVEQLPLLNLSWAQGLDDPEPPGLLHLKWIEPRHMQHQIRRWDRSHQGEIATAFFNGSGVLVWENVFGAYNPWSAVDRATWRRASAILHQFASLFSSERWDPFVPTLVDRLYAHRWPGDRATVYTLRNTGEPIVDQPLLVIPAGQNTVLYDLWNGRELTTLDGGKDTLQVIGSVQKIGCVLAIDKGNMDESLRGLLSRQSTPTTLPSADADRRIQTRSPVQAEPVAKTQPLPSAAIPPGMALVAGTTFRMQIEHQRRECGCYPDPGTTPDHWVDFIWGSPHEGRIRHDIGPLSIEPFFIDETEVSNAEFKRFLDATGYHPQTALNFLKHWPGGSMPAELADHPVVYVDLDDARAYARWAGKRLPTEAEWQLAAQGTDGRAWPWGNTFVPALCNGDGKTTVPVRSYPGGRSPHGCYHMAGNVWEWTESVRDDGHTRFVMIRGGSYFKAVGSNWYTDSGAQPCGHHAKFILMWPGLDRCATVGFRCAADVATPEPTPGKP